MLLVLVEHDRGVLAPATLEAVTFAHDLDTDLHALTIGAAADPIAVELGAYGVSRVHQVHHDLARDYGPDAWGSALARAADMLRPRAVLASGTGRGNEVLAHAAARLDLPFAANCTAATLGTLGDITALTRVRWGGSLLEHAALDSPMPIMSVALHAIDAQPASAPGAAEPTHLAIDLPLSVAGTLVQERVEREAGLTLATAPVVVGGGRGVGSAEGFAALEDLAALLGGVVGCSRAVTNNGWRNHTDQVGQTGTRIAPEIYIACGISGAIQHWVGAMASKHILAINTDPGANMVARADSAVIGDLHEVVPAIAAELRRRGAGN